LIRIIENVQSKVKSNITIVSKYNFHLCNVTYKSSNHRTCGFGCRRHWLMFKIETHCVHFSLISNFNFLRRLIKIDFSIISDIISLPPLKLKLLTCGMCCLQQPEGAGGWFCKKSCCLKSCMSNKTVFIKIQNYK
jgi:hypothetical protein